MRKRNRREFLQDSMLAAAAAAVPSSALFAEEEKQSKSPNERLGVAIVGVNGRGGSHISAFAGRKDAEITYICDVDQKKGPQRCEEIGKRQDGREPTFRGQPAEGARRQVGRHRQHRHAEPLARAARHLGHAGRQGRVRREAGQPQRQRRPPGRRGGPQVQQDLPDRHAEPLDRRACSEAIEYVQDGQDRQGATSARGLCYKPRASIGPKGDYPVPASVDYDLWCGPAPMAPLTRHEVPLRLALAVGLRQRRPGQPGHSPDGHGPLGPGRQRRSASAVIELRRPLRLRSTPARPPTRRSSSTTTATSRWSSRSAA